MGLKSVLSFIHHSSLEEYILILNKNQENKIADNNVIKMADDDNNTGFSSMFEKPRSRIIEDYFSNTPNEEVKFVNERYHDSQWKCDDS